MSSEPSAYNIVTDVGWAAVGVAILLTLGRFYIRWRSSGMNWDDFFNGLALICLIGFAANPNDPDVDTSASWQASMASPMLLWATLWSVKASFLALCWIIFSVSATFRKVWWMIATYTFFTFWPPFLIPLWQCGNPSNYSDPVTCLAFGYTLEGTRSDIVTVAIDLALHLSSELLILTLPLIFIRKLHMSKAKQLSVAGVFLLAISNIVMGILRNATILYFYLSNGSTTDWAITGSMSVFEPVLAVIICALPPYKIFLSRLQRRKNTPTGPQQNVEQRNMAASPGNKPRNVILPLDSITELERATVV